MRKLCFISFILLLACNSFAQKKYGNKIIGRWTFEKFPLHYSVIPANTITKTDLYSKKITSLQQINKFGAKDGLELTMDANGLFPSEASYTYKGQIVYTVGFLANSNFADNISNFDLDGSLDGPQLSRELKDDGRTSVIIHTFKKNICLDDDKLSLRICTANFKDSLLDGEFCFEWNSGLNKIEGIAENGRLKRVKDKLFEIIFEKDSFKIKDIKAGETLFKTLPLRCNPLITTAVANCLKYGNQGEYPYYHISSGGFYLEDFKQVLNRRYPDTLSTKVNYVDGLLDGEFKFREYLGNRTDDTIVQHIDYYGKALKGKITKMYVYNIKPNQDYDIECHLYHYNFINDSIQVFEIPNVEMLEVEKYVQTIKITNPVLLTKSSDLGGMYVTKNYKDGYIEPNGMFNIPSKRSCEMKITGNKKGYAYFNQYEFDVQAYILKLEEAPNSGY